MKDKLKKMLESSTMKSHFIGEKTGKMTRTGIVSIILIISTILATIVFTVVGLFKGFSKGMSNDDKAWFI